MTGVSRISIVDENILAVVGITRIKENNVASLTVMCVYCRFEIHTIFGILWK